MRTNDENESERFLAHLVFICACKRVVKWVAFKQNDNKSEV